ncbi:hypothetical protein ASG43_03265 [Aureimonas sp. Leaf454]|uniref:hypothetical protein n=1 Tax=Aureimonas sp. Leaf454 TaxID=1736381 RepID=UPI0007023B46|nr:hypothetical protein [Aureimonas sp. Leaf454]KQT54619.1 hypothetical protein ASG43_03265 [Aureimonas sp. Leaf454]
MEPEQVAAPVRDDAAAPAAAQEPRRLSADEQKASPEEQELYSRFVAKAFMLVYDKAFLPKAVDMLGGEGDPQEGLARLSAQVTIRVMRLAKEAGQELPGDVLFAAAKEVFEDLAELSRVANVFDYSQDEDALEGAYFRALDHFRMEMEGDGSIDRESAQADLNTLQQMDEAGELEGYFRQLAERDGANRAAPVGEEEAAPKKPAPKRTGLMPQGAK